MSNDLSPAELEQLSALLAAKMGLAFPQNRWHDLERGVVAAAAASGFSGSSAYCQSLLNAAATEALTQAQIEALAIHLTVGETYFFREKPALNALRQKILPDLIGARQHSTRQLRIWSAGCCSGEEAYTTAILLNQLLPDWRAWQVTILGTDINPHFLQKARAGRYGEWSFRDIPPQIREHYFQATPTRQLQILPAIQRQVKFSALNLVDDTYAAAGIAPQSLDLILCRNVLMYFTPAAAKRVIRKLYDALTDGGWLVVGLGELSHLLFADFEMVQFPGAILYRKRSHAASLHAASPDATPPQSALENWFAERAARQPGGQQSHRLDQVAGRNPHRSVSLVSPVSPAGAQARHDQLRPAPGALALDAPPMPVGAQPLHPVVEPTLPVAKSRPKSQVYDEQGAFAEAESQAHAELAAKPQDAAALVQLARLCANQGRLEEALAWCQRSLTVDRLNLRGHYLYATIQQERGEVDEAIQALKRSIYLHPEFVLAHFELGALAQRQGKQEQANKHFANMFAFLQNYQPDELLPESDGLTAGRLAEIVRASTAPRFALNEARQ
jgi:chemotaxis protein methyltransferase CheR